MMQKILTQRHRDTEVWIEKTMTEESLRLCVSVSKNFKPAGMYVAANGVAHG
ncbi:MAG: hypothetical protein QG652_646 [Pseudomonadota bacterium]|nr:hypothetical protein [Pseudomonadota bacterium]